MVYVMISYDKSLITFTKIRCYRGYKKSEMV